MTVYYFYKYKFNFTLSSVLGHSFSLFKIKIENQQTI